MPNVVPVRKGRGLQVYIYINFCLQGVWATYPVSATQWWRFVTAYSQLVL